MLFLQDAGAAVARGVLGRTVDRERVMRRPVLVEEAAGAVSFLLKVRARLTLLTGAARERLPDGLILEVDAAGAACVDMGMDEANPGCFILEPAQQPLSLWLPSVRRTKLTRTKGFGLAFPFRLGAEERLYTETCCSNRTLV